jgi:hypothetical protein
LGSLFCHLTATASLSRLQFAVALITGGGDAYRPARRVVLAVVRIHIEESALLATCITLVSCLTYSSTMKIVETCSSETSINFQRSTRCYIPEDRILHNNSSENLKSHKIHIDVSCYDNVQSGRWEEPTVSTIRGQVRQYLPQKCWYLSKSIRGYTSVPVLTFTLKSIRQIHMKTDIKDLN